MKKKIKKILVVCTLIAVSLGLGSTVSNARHIGDLSNFRVLKSGNSTSSLKKLNNSETVINLSSTKTGKVARVDNYNNSNKYMGGTSVWTGTRKTFSDKSVKGNYYYLKLSNTEKGQANFSAYGSWSPDSY